MLTARSVIIAVIVIAVLSILLAIVDLLSPPDSGGLGRDSYGTIAMGHRAVFELLEELEVPVERSLVPPTAAIRRDVCLVFCSPDAGLINAEPDYLRRVGHWVRQGGAVVIAPASGDPESVQAVPIGVGFDFHEKVDPLEALGLEGLQLTTVFAVGTPIEERKSAKAQTKARTSPFGVPRIELPAIHSIEVRGEGELGHLTDILGNIAAPADGVRVIDGASSATAAGRVLYESSDGGEHTLAALYPLGRGQVIVVGDPLVLVNLTLGRADNSILAAHLLAHAGRPVVFDEFYHGLTIRGNPLWLVKRRPFGLLAALLLLVVGVWVWRGSVVLGPPLRERRVQRRTVREYVEAMGRLFDRGRCQPFVLNELRKGLLWAMCRKLHLSRKHEDVDRIAGALERRSPDEARRLVGTVRELDAVLTGRKPLRRREYIDAARKVSEWL